LVPVSEAAHTVDKDFLLSVAPEERIIMTQKVTTRMLIVNSPAWGTQEEREITKKGKEKNK
jgi:hypothetical protein